MLAGRGRILNPERSKDEDKSSGRRGKEKRKKQVTNLRTLGSLC